jgi:hypothetical protein
MPSHVVHHRFLQLPAVCETRQDAEIVLEALHRAYRGRPGFVETKGPSSLATDQPVSQAQALLADHRL